MLSFDKTHLLPILATDKLSSPNWLYKIKSRVEQFIEEMQYQIEYEKQKQKQKQIIKKQSQEWTSYNISKA
jgi:hypothetical protein